MIDRSSASGSDLVGGSGFGVEDGEVFVSFGAGSELVWELGSRLGSSDEATRGEVGVATDPKKPQQAKTERKNNPDITAKVMTTPAATRMTTTLENWPENQPG